MPLRTIYHVAAPWQNFGDKMLARIQQATLQADLGEMFNFVNVDCQESELGQRFVEIVNQHAAMVWVGGGGLIMARETAQDGLQLKGDLVEWNALKVPVVVQAIGWNEFPHDAELAEAVKSGKLVERLEELAVMVASMFSVRNGYTADQVAAAGFLGVHVVPDAALFTQAATSPLNSSLFRRNRGPVVGLVLAYDRPTKRFATEGAAWNYALNVANGACKAAAQMGGSVLHICHTPNELGRCSDDLTAAAGRHNVGVHHATHPDMSAYARCDMVLSQRKHGVILSAAAGKPVAVLGKQAELLAIATDIYGTDAVTELTSPHTSAREVTDVIVEMTRGSKLAGELRNAGHERIGAERKILRGWNERIGGLL